MTQDTLRTGLGYGVPITWLLVLVVLFDRLSPVARLLGATVVLLATIKVGSWLLLSVRSRDVSLSTGESLLFWTVWPGVRPDLFAASDDAADPDASSFVTGYAFVLGGLGLALLSLLAVPFVGLDGSTWMLLVAFLAVIHAGIGRLLPFFLRWLGYPAPPLFNAPLRSQGVGEFWSDRWNRPFIGMNRLFLTKPLSKRVGMGTAAMAAFVASGVMHELAISYAAGAGFGLPFLYFLLQGVCYTAEQRVVGEPDGDWSLARRLWTMLAVLGPLPLLFHGPFRMTFLAPLVEAGRTLLLSAPLSAYLGAGLWVGAGGHFLVLAASHRVPAELDWETDLESLDPFNRKLMWTYGGYIVLSIVSFGVLTALFHEQFLAGTPVALGVCGVIVVFWTIRVLVDALYFSHEDWPEGIEYVVGHALLTSLFVLLIVVYGGTIVFHLA
jgi:alginate O-acetyltransferase complex protein AlgI